MLLDLGPTDSLNKIEGLATLGLLILLASGRLSSYAGPSWPVGRFGQRINKPSPEIVLRMLGWILLFLVLMIFGYLSYQRG
jgi:hypothetical protein